MVEQHGTESHLVRPDRVYATSVWTAIPGYQPVSAAMQVAARFVQGQPGLGSPFRRRRGLRGAGLGFSFGGIFNWLRDLIAGLAARLTAWKIQKQLATSPTASGSVVSVDTSPRPTKAAQIVDSIRGLLVMPSTTTPASAAAALTNQLTVANAAPTVTAAQASYMVAPGSVDMTTYLTNQWRQGN